MTLTKVISEINNPGKQQQKNKQTNKQKQKQKNNPNRSNSSNLIFKIF